MKSILAVIGIYGAILFLPGTMQAQTPAQADTATINALLTKSKELANNMPEEAIRYSLEAKELAEKTGFSKGAASALKTIGNVFYTQGKHLEAISYWMHAMEVFKSMNDLVGVSNILNNIGVVYSIQGDYDKALENYLNALQFAEKSGDKERIWTSMSNVGANYALRPDTYDKALEYYLKALPITEEIKDLLGIANLSANIGEVYSNKGNSLLALDYFKKSMKAYQDSKNDVYIPFAYNATGKEYKKLGNFDLALQYHNLAYTTAKKTDNKLYMVHSLMGLAAIYTIQQKFDLAIDHYKQAERIGSEIIALDELKDIYQGLAGTYASQRQYDKAFQYVSLYTSAKDTLYNIATDKKLARMEFDFNLQKKQGEINLLTKDQALRVLELKRQKQAKYAFMAGLALLGLIAFILYRNYRAKAKINQVLDHQKDQIEGLLLNILPAEVAKELQETGAATPRHYENVSVLFTDFKGFTSLADKMSPGELVEELSACFTAFDNIIEKHKLEKIKTIGDAYMCAGGIPIPDKDHHFRIVRASMEIQDYVLKHNLKRKSRGLPPWDIRIGIHAGPVVAGVVGKKKYAYDIWGSTVNIASRMESNGVPGQINISSAMYDIIKDRYVCSHRGKILAKNVGEIDMYFLEHEIRIPVRDFQPEIILQ